MLREWLKTLLALIMLFGALELLLPEGDIGKFPKLIIGLAMLLAVIQPLTTLLNQNISLGQIQGEQFVNDNLDIQVLGIQLQEVGIQPFLRGTQPELARRLESLLLIMEQIDDVCVEIKNSNGIYGAVIKINPFDGEREAKVKRIASGILGLESELILVESL